MSQSSPDPTGGDAPEAAVRPSGEEEDRAGMLVIDEAALLAGQSSSWAEVLLEAEGPILQMIGAARPLGSILDAICLMTEALCDDAACTVLLLEDDGRTPRSVAAPSLPEAFRRAPEGLTSCRETAVLGGEPALCEDIPAEAASGLSGRVPVEFGLLACLCVPFASAAGQALGTLGLYFREARRPTAREARVARRAGKLAAIAVERFATEDRYRRIVETANEGIWQIDAQQRTVFVNPRMAEMLGYGLEEMLGRSAWGFAFEEDVADGQEQWDRRTRGERGSREFRLRRKDGSAVWTQSSTTPVYDADGRFMGALGMFADISERKRAEEALRASEAHYRAVYDQAAVGIAEVDMSGRFTRVNDRYCEIVGHSREDLLGRPFQAITHPDDLTEKLEFFTQIADRQTPYTLEKRYVRRDGQLVWVRVAVAMVRDGEGGPASVLAVAENITDWKEAEQALRESEDRFRQLAGTIPQIVWISQPDFSVEFFNERWFEYTGLDAEQSYSPDGWRAAVHPDDIGRVLEAGALSRGPSGTFEAEYRLRDRNGAYRWHLGRAVPVLDARGNVLRRLGTATDIHDRRRAEHDARFLADAGATLAALTDEAGALGQLARLAVPHFADWCAVDLVGDEGLLRRLAVAHIDPAKVELSYEMQRRYPARPDNPGGIYAVLRTGQPVLVPEITDRMLVEGAQDGEHLRILRELGLKSFLCVPLNGRTGPLGTISFVAAESGRRYGPDDQRLAEDLARRAAVAFENARLYDALREADRRKDEFLATLAHELRNPLAPIRSALHLMGRPDAEGRNHEADRAMAERQVAHLSRLVDDLMDVARISRGKFELKRQVVELGAIVAHAIEAARPALAERGHELVVELPAERVVIEADPTRLEQVIDNLLTNANKYSEPGGRITLAAGREGDEAVIRVADTGIGIPAEMLPRVFEMFAQVEVRSARAQGGLGIGLSLVRSLVEMHGGTITASSAGAGAGSEFTVRLPAVSAMDATAEPPKIVDDRAALPRRRILVVDDNVDAAVSLAKLLRRVHGQDVQVAHDGPGALSAAEAFRPEVVLLDIGMPGMDGYEVARRLRSRPEFTATTLVALTGWGQESDRQKTKAAGFDKHVVKPVDPKRLGELLAPAAENI